jgi:hypothetical protein
MVKLLRKERFEEKGQEVGWKRRPLSMIIEPTPVSCRSG